MGVNALAAPALLKPVCGVAEEVADVGAFSRAATIEGTLAHDMV